MWLDVVVKRPLYGGVEFAIAKLTPIREIALYRAASHSTFTPLSGSAYVGARDSVSACAVNEDDTRAERGVRLTSRMK